MGQLPFLYKEKPVQKHRFCLLSSSLLHHVEEQQDGQNDTDQAVQIDNRANNPADDANDHIDNGNEAQNGTQQTQNQADDQTGNQVDDDADNHQAGGYDQQGKRTS